MEGDRVTFELHPDLAVLPLLDLRADFLKTLSTCLSVMMPLIGWASKVLCCLWFTEMAPVVESPNKVAEGCSTFIDPGPLPLLRVRHFRAVGNLVAPWSRSGFPPARK